jgi:hypothetical protein
MRAQLRGVPPSGVWPITRMSPSPARSCSPSRTFILREPAPDRHRCVSDWSRRVLTPCLLSVVAVGHRTKDVRAC